MASISVSQRELPKATSDVFLLLLRAAPQVLPVPEGTRISRSVAMPLLTSTLAARMRVFRDAKNTSCLRGSPTRSKKKQPTRRSHFPRSRRTSSRHLGKDLLDEECSKKRAAAAISFSSEMPWCIVTISGRTWLFHRLRHACTRRTARAWDGRARQKQCRVAAAPNQRIARRHRPTIAFPSQSKCRHPRSKGAPSRREIR